MKTKIAPKFVFIGIWFTLICLLFIMYGLAQFNLGTIGTVVIMILAFTQMLLVLSFFMRLRNASKIIRLFSLAGFCWLLFLFILAFADYLTRQWH